MLLLGPLVETLALRALGMDRTEVLSGNGTVMFDCLGVALSDDKLDIRELKEPVPATGIAELLSNGKEVGMDD